MKPIFTISFILVFNLFSMSQIPQIPRQTIPEDYGYIVKIGQQMPEIEFELTNGEKIKTRDLKGKVVMLQFTASWCSVCRKEMPHIENDIWSIQLFTGCRYLPITAVNKYSS